MLPLHSAAFMRTPMTIESRAWWLLLPVLVAWAWTTWLGYSGLNGQDAYDYLRIAKGWIAWAHSGAMPLMKEHPHGYPIAGAVLGALLGSPAFGLQLISLLGMCALALAVRASLIKDGERTEVNRFVLLAIVLSPFMLRHALVDMSDVGAVALVMTAFGALIAWRRRRRAWLVAAWLICALLAISFRLAAVPMLAAMLFPPVMRAIPRGRSMIACVSAGFLALATSLWLWNAEIHLADRGPMAEWSLLNLFRTELHSDDGVLNYRWPNLIYVLSVFVHPGFVPIGALLLPFVRVQDFTTNAARIALPMVIGYLLFIGGMPFQNDRVLLMAQPLAAILLFPAFLRATEWAKDRGIRPSHIVVALAFAQAGLFVRAMMPFIHQARVERQLAAALNERSAGHIYTHGMGAAFDELCPEADITELWYGRIGHFESGSYVVVQPAAMSIQWRSRPPQLNWERMQRQGVVIEERGPEGWVIARVL